MWLLLGYGALFVVLLFGILKLLDWWFGEWPKEEK